MMRPKPSLVALTLVAVALVGCASPWKAAQNKFDREWYWMPIAQYNAMVHERDGFNSATPAAAAMAAGANDVTGERTARCASVFSLFASYIRPGCNSGDMGKFLGDAHWLQQTDVVAAGTSGGQIVLFGDIDAARFRLSLFRDDVGWMPK